MATLTLADVTELSGKMVNVTVSVGKITDTKELKVCKVKARSILFITVDRPNRKNIFRKVNLKDIDLYVVNPPKLRIKSGVLPTKWESDWDSIGTVSPSALNSRFPAKSFSNHSKGWAHTLNS